MTHLLVKPRELHGSYVPNKSGNGPANVRRQGSIGGEQRQEIRDNTELARLSDVRQTCDSRILTQDAVQERRAIEEGANEPNDVVSDRRRHGRLGFVQQTVDVTAADDREESVERDHRLDGRSLVQVTGQFVFRMSCVRGTETRER